MYIYMYIDMYVYYMYICLRISLPLRAVCMGLIFSNTRKLEADFVYMATHRPRVSTQRCTDGPMSAEIALVSLL